jgi:hypothetical protein
VRVQRAPSPSHGLPLTYACSCQAARPSIYEPGVGLSSGSSILNCMMRRIIRAEPKKGRWTYSRHTSLAGEFTEFSSFLKLLDEASFLKTPCQRVERVFSSALERKDASFWSKQDPGSARLGMDL